MRLGSPTATLIRCPLTCPAFTPTGGSDIEIVASVRMALRAMSLDSVMLAGITKRTSPHVLRMCYGLQMNRPDASTDTAQMIDFQPIRDGADPVLIGPTVRADSTFGTEAAIASVIRRGQPQPASVGLLHLGQKSCFRVHDLVYRIESSSNKRRPAALYTWGRVSLRLAAVLIGSIASRCFRPSFPLPTEGLPSPNQQENIERGVNK